MSTPIKTPPSVNTSEDPGLEYLNQREIEIAITPVENTTKDFVFEEVTQIITNVFQVNGPSGANGQLQFNQNGQYIGDAELQYDPNTDTLTTGSIIANSIRITGNASSFKLNGGYNNEVLKTDGNGNLSWANVFPSVVGNTGKFLVTNGVSIDWSTSNYNSFATTTYVTSAIANLVGTAPAMLDTLAEIANVIGQTNDPQYGIISQLANKANISNLSQVAFSGSYADLSNRPNISTVGSTGNYSDLNSKPTIPASILDLGISDGTVGQVLTTRGNGTYHFTTVTSGSNANIGNIGFSNTVIYSNTGTVINNSDLSNGQTAGLVIPAQGDGNTSALFNTYGNVTILAGNIGNSQPVQAWTFNPAGALFFPQTPYVTSAILVNDNNQELSVSTDRGNISIWPENSKWLFGADGNLTLPHGSTISNTTEIVTVTLDQFTAGGFAGTRVFTKVSDTLYELSPTGPYMTLISNVWRLKVGPATYYDSTDLITWSPIAGSLPAPVGTLGTVASMNLGVGSNTWEFGEDGKLTLPGGAGSLFAYGDALQLDGAQDTGIQIASLGEGYTRLLWSGGQEVGDVMVHSGNDRVIITAGNLTTGLNEWKFNNTGTLTLPQGTILSETANTTVITPPNALAGQGLVVRLTGVQGIMSDHPGGFTDGDTITLTVTPDYGSAQVTGTLDYTFTGATSIQLGRALTGTLTFNNASSMPISWTIPVSSTMTTFTVTISNASGFAITSVDNTLTLTTTGSSEDHHVHLIAGDPSITDIYLGDDDQYVKIEKNGGNVVIGTDTNSRQWTFDFNGTTTFPGNLVIAGNTSVFGTNRALIQPSDDLPLIALSSGANGAVSSVWVEDIGNVGTSNIAAVYANPTSGSKIVRIVVGQNGVGSGPNLWDFGATGNLTLPTGGNLIVSGSIVGSGASPAPTLSGFSSVSALEFKNGTSNVTVNANSNLWKFDSTGNLTIPGSSGGFIKTVSNASIGIAAVDNGTDNPAQLLSINAGSGAATSIVSAYATNATIQTNATGAINTWKFDNAGNLTLPANTFAINYANGTQVSLGSGSSSNISNGNSNVSIATENGNVTIASAGNTTMTITGTGAIITGIAKPTGTSVTGVNSVLAGPTFTPLANTMGGFVSNVNSYTQLTIQNKNTGADATTDFIATADNGSDTVNYLDMGIINSGYDALTPTNSLGNIVYAADSYIYAQGNTSAVSQSGGNLAIGTTVAGKTVKIFAGGVTASNVVATVANTGVTVNGNVTVSSGSFVGNGAGLTNVTVNAAGNIQGTSSNVSLVAGSYTMTFDNTGILTLPRMGGDEGGEINFGIPASNTTLSTRVVVDVFQDRLRIFDGSTKGVYIDLSQASSGVGTLLNNRVSGFVNAGTFVTMDNIKATVTTTGNRGLSLATTTGTVAYSIGGTYGMATPSSGGSAGTGTLTTTATASIFNWGFTSTSDTSTYILTDTTNSRAYRITLQIGGSFNNNMISIERLI